MQSTATHTGLGFPFTLIAAALPFAIKAVKAMGQNTAEDRNGVQALLQKIIGDNSLWLYPRAEHGGPWPQKGAGDIDNMTEDELRYFIEWRLPLYLKFIGNISNFEPGTKKRVQNRYIAATKGLIELSKDKFRQRYGCYINSGLYSGAGQSGSNTIKHFDQNCNANSGNSGNGGNTPKPKKAGISGNMSTVVLLLGGAAAAIAIAKNSANKPSSPAAKSKKQTRNE